MKDASPQNYSHGNRTDSPRAIKDGNIIQRYTWLVTKINKNQNMDENKYGIKKKSTYIKN